MMRAAIVHRPLHPTSVLQEVASVSSGASVLFVGTVRDTNEGRLVTGIEYAAYESMAIRELDAIVREATDQFGTDHVVIEHRIGQLSLGEASVVIAVSHAHRAEAYECSRFIIEELKRRVPIWKREEYVDGAREWVDPTTARAEVRP